MFNYKHDLNYNIAKNITTHQLIKLIQSNHNKDTIIEIRALRRAGDETYKSLKETLPVFVPNAVFDTKVGSDNFMYGTGYYYLDIDDGNMDAFELKKQFLDKYKNLVYLCWVSASLGGIGILVKLDDVLSKVEDFHFLYSYLTKEVFSDFKFDTKVKNAGRINFISHDPDLFINNDSVIEISTVDLNTYCEELNKKNISDEISKKEKGLKQHYNKGNSNHSCFRPFKNKDISSGLLLQTDMNWKKGEFVKFEMVEDYIDCRIYRKVNDGKKRDLFTQKILGLLELNGLEKESQILRQVKFYNKNNTTIPMTDSNLEKLFNSVVKGYKNGELKAIGKPKYIHLNPSISGCKSKKISIRNKMSGYAKRLRTQSVIEKAREVLISQGKKPTQENVAKAAGMCLSTVKNYWNLEPLELSYFEELVGTVNEDFNNNRHTFYDKNYIGKEIESAIEELDFTIDKETGELIHDEVMDTQNQGETISVTYNTIEEKQDGKGTSKHEMDMAAFIQRFNAELRYLEPWNRDTNDYSPYTIRKISLRENIAITGFDMDFDREWNKKYAHAL